jgi:hypothetical protein
VRRSQPLEYKQIILYYGRNTSHRVDTNKHVTELRHYFRHIQKFQQAQLRNKLQFSNLNNLMQQKRPIYLHSTLCTTVSYRNLCTTVSYRNLCTTVSYRNLCTKPAAHWRTYAIFPITSRPVKPILTSLVGSSYSSCALFSVCYLMTLSVTQTTHILTACTNVIKKLSGIFPPPPAEACCTINI